jgi:hypothetical protein
MGKRSRLLSQLTWKHWFVCYGFSTMYKNAGGFVFVGVAVGSLISAGLGYDGFGFEASVPVVLCGIAAYYYGKSEEKDS